MPEHTQSEAALPTERRSRKLVVAVIFLAILPLLLPFPFSFLELLWIAPLAHAQRQPECAFYNCPVAANLERLGWLLVLGPSIFVALAAILFGAIGLFRSRPYPLSQKNGDWFLASVVIGAVQAVFLGCILGLDSALFAGIAL